MRLNILLQLVIAPIVIVAAVITVLIVNAGVHDEFKQNVITEAELYANMHDLIEVALHNSDDASSADPAQIPGSNEIRSQLETQLSAAMAKMTIAGKSGDLLRHDQAPIHEIESRISDWPADVQQRVAEILRSQTWDSNSKPEFAHVTVDGHPQAVYVRSCPQVHLAADDQPEIDVVLIPVGHLHRQIANVRNLLILSFVAMLSLILTGHWFVSRRMIVAPIRDLQRRVESLMDQDLPDPDQESRRVFVAELSSCHHALDFVTRRLHRYRAQRDKHIHRLNVTSQQLHESEQHARRFHTLGMVGMFEFDHQFNWIDINEHMARMLGYDAQELMYRTWTELVHPNDLPRHDAAIEQLVEGESHRVEFEVQLLHRTGRHIPCAVAISGFRDPRTNTLGFIGVAMDLTKQKAALDRIAQSESQYRAVIESAQEGIAVTDRRGQLFFTNAQFARLLELTVGQVVGRSFLDFVHPEDRRPAARMFSQAQADTVVRTELRMQSDSGPEASVLVTASRQDNGKDGPLGTLLFITDITARRRAEESLRRAYTQLEERVDQRTAELGEANRKLRDEINIRAAAQRELEVLANFQRSLIDAIPNPLFHVDEHGVLRLYNQAFARLMGIGVDRAGSSLAEIVSDENFRQLDRDHATMLHSIDHSTYEITLNIQGRDPVDIVVYKAALRQDDDASSGVIASLIDVTELREAQQQRRASLARLRAFVGAIPDGVYITDRDMRFVEVLAPSPLIMTRQGQCEGQLIHDWLDPAAALEIELACRETLRLGKSQIFELQMPGDEGATRFFEGRTGLISGRDEGASLVLWSVREVTARRRFELELQQQRQFSDQLITAADVAILVVNTENKVIRINPSLEQLIGRRCEDVADQPIDLLPVVESDRQQVAGLFEQALDRNRPSRGHVISIRRPDGMERQLLWNVQPLRDAQGRVSGALAIGLDETERLTAEEALRQSEAQLRTITDAAEAGIFLRRQDELLYTNPSMRQMFGGKAYFTQERQHPTRWVAPEDSDAIRDMLHHRGADASRPVEVTCQRADGSTFAAVMWSRRITYRGRPASVGTVLDISERRAAEDRLRLFESIVSQIDEAVVVTEPRLEKPGPRIEYVNEAFTLMTGYTADEAVGATPRILQGPRTDRAVLDRLKRELNKGLSFRGQTINYRKDGQEYHVDWTVNALRDRNGEIQHWVSVQRDVTEQMHFEQIKRVHQAELAHVGRLSAMGEMAAGLAHELNQPLTAISNYAQGCIRRAQAPEVDPNVIVQGMEHITRQAHRAGEIITRLRRFVRQGEFQSDLVQTDELIHDVVQLCQADLNDHGVTLELDLDDHLPQVSVDTIQIQQVMVNLVRNAIDAMDEDPPDDTPTIRIQVGNTDEREVLITVSDNGPGMDEQQVLKIFDPFFTTKANGMGIGLTISQSIIEMHGGRIWAQRLEDRGLRMCVSLPIGSEDTTRQSDDGQAPMA